MMCSRSLLALLVVTPALAHCSSSAAPAGDTGGDANAACYPDTDGLNSIAAVVYLTVDDSGFSKKVISSQNDSPVKLTLMNTGRKPHGFEVGCQTTTAPAGCPAKVCFPGNSTIAPLQPGESKTITFQTPTPDGILYPFQSSEPDDANVAGFRGQWSLM